jgi:hypothetical protein
MRALKTSLRARVEAEEKPLKQRRHISKKTKFSEAPQKYGLPRLEGQLEDKGK